MSVKDKHPDYDEFAPLWKRCDDASEGQAAIHKATTIYLPKLADETQLQYEARVARSDFFNATWRTIAGLTGMAFAKPPVVTLPLALAQYTSDINMAGSSLNSLARDVVEDVLEYGRIGLMVDMPPALENVTGLSLASYENLGIRPTISCYSAEHITNWRFGRVRNAYVLTMVTLSEQVSIAQDEFEHKTETRYRVLDLDPVGAYRQRIFRINKDGKDEQVGEDIYPRMRGQRMGFIPFYFVGAGGKADDIDTPPMIDLVDANIAHYQVNADYRHGLHFTALPTPVISGYAPETSGEKFYIGSLSAWVFPDPNARASYLEFQGAGLSELREALRDLEKRMAVLGARMLTDESRHAQTLGEAQMRNVGENSVLATITIAVSDAIEWALGVFADWIGASGEIVYQINRDFLPRPMDAQTLTALVGAWQSGAISEAELFANLQRGEVIDGQKTLEQHQEEAASTPAIAAPIVAAAA
jgi:hypothetical protein